MVGIFVTLCQFFSADLAFSDCKAGPYAELACHNDTLSVTWSTGMMFDATVTRIPGELAKRFTD